MKKAVRLDKFLADAGAGTRSEVKKNLFKKEKSRSTVCLQRNRRSRSVKRMK